METQKVSPLVGLLDFLATFASGNPFSDKQITNEVGNITVDTCLPKDTRIWETGINRPDIEGKWVIVEQYEDEDTAKVGHEKWVKLMTDDPNHSLKDIDMWSLDKDEEK